MAPAMIVFPLPFARGRGETVFLFCKRLREEDRETFAIFHLERQEAPCAARP